MTHTAADKADKAEKPRILEINCTFRGYSSRFSGGEKNVPSCPRVAMDSREESMRSFLSGFEGIVK